MFADEKAQGWHTLFVQGNTKLTIVVIVHSDV